MTTTPSYKIADTIMMQLGDYQFGLSTAAYQELARSTEYRWPSQDVFGVIPRLQFTGPGAETITLPGVVYPEFRGGSKQIVKMRETAAKGEPLMMVAGTGDLMGKWVIEKIDSKETVFAAKGLARKMEFTISLRKFPD